MPPTHVLVSSASLALALVLASQGSARACTIVSCYSGGEYLPASGTVPANLPSILFYPRYNHAAGLGGATVALFRIEAGTQVPVEIATQVVDTNILITPTLPLAPDSDYALEGAELCASGVTKATFHTGAAAPFPTTLGTLTQSEQHVDSLQVAAGGLCSLSVSAATVAVDIALSAEAEPWKGALSLRTIVDGAPWYHASTLGDEPPLGGRMHEILYAACDGSVGPVNNLDVGTHTVWMEATIPGSTTALKTAPISVTLSCPTPSGTGGSGGGGSGGNDTGGSDGGGARGVAVRGCGMGGGGKDGAWALSVLAALATLGLRRRRSTLG